MNSRRLTNLIRGSSYPLYCNRYCTAQHNHRLTDFPATYEAKDVAKGRYEIWEKNGYFLSGTDGKETFKMILPPPNITGVLHLGHALTATIQDILARWHKMNGDSVIWIPGLDHAGIATQAVIEKCLLKKDGVTKFDLGREKFLSVAWEWKRDKAESIVNQLKVLGASVDWSKQYFTMDKHHNTAVTETFVTLNKRNMLYRDKCMINWSTALNSTISDIEVNTIEIAGKTDLSLPGYKKKVRFGQMYEIAYPIKDSKDELIVATTRPETVFGDVALAVHPNDTRYSKYIGQYVWHPVRETYIPIISDSAVNIEFGTGVVKITPAHDHLDYTIAKKHQLEIIDVIDENGKITAASKNYQGLQRFVAREKVINELTNEGFLRNIKDHKMTLPICSRSNDVIEYFLREQWFVRCKDMADRAIKAVKDGQLKINPTIHEQMWYERLGEIRDWCISRQLWWGHRIPAYYINADSKEEWVVAKSKEEAMRIAQKKYGELVELHQDKDVLDTWFSSALLPLTVTGWPMKNLDEHWPLSLMETGHDIFIFWVARMVMLSLELTNQLPFKEVLLHGVLCDGNGRKMSKSSGNVILPENVINGITFDDLNAEAKARHDAGLLSNDELKRTLKINKSIFHKGIPDCGVDALRMTLSANNIKGSTVTFDVNTCITNKRFCNKIWQASKYALLMATDDCYNEPAVLSTLDYWILSRLSLMVQRVNDAFANKEFHQANESIKQFLYYEFCDFYVEGTKWGFKSNDSNIMRGHSYTLIKCLEVSLRVLSPIMPYLTDDLYLRLAQKLPGFLPVPSLIKATFPASSEFEELRNSDLDERMSEAIQIVKEIREVIAYVSKKLISEVHIVVDNNTDAFSFYNESLNLIKGGSRIMNMSVHQKHNYVANSNSVELICDTSDMKCSIFVNAQDESALKQMSLNIDKRKLREEEELKKEIVQQ